MRILRAVLLVALGSLAPAAATLMWLPSCALQGSGRTSGPASPTTGFIMGIAPTPDGNNPRLMEYYLELSADGRAWCWEPQGVEVRGSHDIAKGASFRVHYTASYRTEPWEAQVLERDSGLEEALPPDAMDRFEFKGDGGLFLVESTVGHPLGAWHLVSAERGERPLGGR